MDILAPCTSRAQKFLETQGSVVPVLANLSETGRQTLALETLDDQGFLSALALQEGRRIVFFHRSTFLRRPNLQRSGTMETLTLFLQHLMVLSAAEQLSPSFSSHSLKLCSTRRQLQRMRKDKLPWTWSFTVMTWKASPWWNLLNGTR